MKQYRKAADADKRPAHFVQGFTLGLIFGVSGALIMLGRNNK